MSDEEKMRPAREETVEQRHVELARAAVGKSALLAGFGAVTPRRRPEDFAALRAEFERGVAEQASRW